MKIKALIFGAQGMFGRTLSAYLSQKGVHVEARTQRDMDLRQPDYEQISAWVHQVSFVVNAAALLQARMHEFTPVDVFSVNSVFPKNLGRICAKAEVPCFLISTDSVFSESRGACHEDDIPDPKDLYSMSKLLGESEKVMTIRTSLIGEDLSNSRSLLEWAKSEAGQKVKGFTNHLWNGVTTLQLSHLILELFKAGLYKPGVQHLFSSQKISKFDLLQIINRVYDLNLAIEAVEAPLPVHRWLETRRAWMSQFGEMPIEKQLLNLKAFFKEKKGS